MANNKLPDVELKMLNGRPTVHIDGKPDPFNTYHNFGLKKIKHTMAWFATVPMDVYYIAPDRLPQQYPSCQKAGGFLRAGRSGRIYPEK